MNWWTLPYQLPMFRGVGRSHIALNYSDTKCLEKSSLVRNASVPDKRFWKDEKLHLQYNNINLERTFINLMGVS